MLSSLACFHVSPVRSTNICSALFRRPRRCAVRVLLINRCISSNLLRVALYVAKRALMLHGVASVLLEPSHGLPNHKLEGVLLCFCHEADIREVVLSDQDVYLLVHLTLHSDEQCNEFHLSVSANRYYNSDSLWLHISDTAQHSPVKTECESKSLWLREG